MTLPFITQGGNGAERIGVFIDEKKIIAFILYTWPNLFFRRYHEEE